MLLNRPATTQPLQQQRFYRHQPQPHRQPQGHHFYPHPLDVDNDTNPDDSTNDINISSISSSPLSTQSFTSQHYSLGAHPSSSFPNFNSSHLAVPRRVAPVSAVFDDSPYNTKPIGRFSHQRESSLSSLGSAGPASPFSHNTSNPQIAVTDSTPDGLYDMQTQDSHSFYQLAKAMPSHDNVYPNYNGLAAIPSDMSGYTSALNIQRPRSDRSGLLPAPELSVAGSSRSHPNSVASSVAGDSPATPSAGDHEDDRRRKAVFSSVPKLDRTMTDIYNDELYSPNFTITSASPAHSQMAMSPNNDVFAQRLNAANNQHLSAAQSPASSGSRDRSPFRQGSPLAPVANHEFGANLAGSRLRFNSARQMREQKKAERDAQILRQQLSMKSEPETPKTISPKDAMLEFHDAEGDDSFPLFPSQNAADFDDLVKSAVPQDHSSTYVRTPVPSAAAFPYVAMQFPNGVQIPQQYPFIAHSRQSHEQTPRLSSAESSSGTSEGTSSSTGGPLVKPVGAAADGGTYTCTYHGCTLRFETPALLQKHKREGHRQTQTLGGPRRPDASIVPTPNSLLNSQAGPHRCDRINPSTGKPCHTIFSRPYDLTRHEDTIHNARKQKVRCNLCTEEKTFSRADALTRHYRVCHPDVEFPGKHRRRGQLS
ncbi:Transcriptional regulator RPN4 [Colletotrichum fructicola Nara gc5]|uniref:Transcriptional regulator RPN4 n=1 Tax=Colletotrichum fructicola (strain Nara gc5) TaxID=1213859 RepID=A0A7J6J104_COLFN|nr:Transcriptional regulator RPN4 [Colletotrichum fructicola Nara gc5]